MSNNKGDQVRHSGKLRSEIPYYILALPGLILLLLFAYFPMSGVLLAFKQYTYKGGIFGSPFANPWYNNFLFFLNNGSIALRAVRNTIMFNTISFLFNSAVSIAIAIMLKEMRGRMFVKITQSAMFLPYFISWAVIGCILTNALLNYDGGIINKAIVGLGFSRVDFYENPWYWLVILVLTEAWHSCGYSSIIYYGVLSGVNPEYYEAAQIDGASKWQQIRRISIPMLKSTFVTLFLLSVGGMLKGNLTMVIGTTNLNPSLLEVTDFIDVYIYRSGIKNGEMVFSSAISLLQSVFGLILILISNALIRRYDQELAIF